MLSALRKSAGGIVAKIFLGLLVISFAIWGVSGAIVSGTGSSTVTFGDTKVGLSDFRLAYNSQVDSLKRQLGQRITREQSKAFGIEQAVISQVSAGAVLDENAKQMGLGVTQDQLARQIADDPAFKDGTGVFSRSRLEFALREIGMSQEDYVRTRQSVALRSQILDAITGGLSSTQAFKNNFAAMQAEKRVFDFANVTSSALKEAPVPADSDLQAWYDDHKADFMAPEYRKLVVVSVEPKDIAKPDSISEEDVKADYEKQKASYTTAETRRIQQIVFPDRAAADAALVKLKSGLPLEVLLGDLKRTEADIDLGTVSKAQIPDSKVADAAFLLAQNAFSDIIDGSFGPVILRVTEINPEVVKPLSDVEAEIRSALALEKAVRETPEIHDLVEDERAAGSTLREAATKAGLTARTIEAVDAKGKAPDGTSVEPLPEQAKLLGEAFQTDEGVEADPILIGSTGYEWFEVVSVTPERQKPLDEVRDAVSAAWVEAETAKRVGELAISIRDRVAKGEEFAAVIAEMLPVGTDGNPAAIETSAAMLRTDKNDKLPSAAVSTGFTQAKDTLFVADGAKPGEKLVMKIVSVNEGQPGPVPDNITKQLDGAIGDDVLNALVADYQSRGELVINSQAIDAALSY
ncbi:MAG: SurA N-terminal domain-containing protein [Nitratireductor sp.]